jgi:hypothetical protein
VFVLLTMDGDGNVYVVDEHVQSRWLPERHAEGVRAMLGRNGLPESLLWSVPAGADVFAKKSERTIADEYEDQGIHLTPAVTDRINGAAEVARRLGDSDHGIEPSIFIFKHCVRLIECLPALQHDQSRPEDVKKWDVDEDGKGGDDSYDALRYGLMSGVGLSPSTVSLPPVDALRAAERTSF